MNNLLDKSLFFDNHPDAMWIYDLESLAFLAVNDAAISRYGYSRDEFLAMTLRDIRPEEDIPALVASVQGVTGGLDQAGTWRHRLKSGEVIHVEISSHTLTYEGRKAELVSARDVTKVVTLERERTLLLASEQQQRQQAEEAAARFRTLFENSPYKILVLSPENLNIIAVSNAYLEATLTAREKILERHIFDVFPDNPNDHDANGTRNLRASLRHVLATSSIDVMPLQRYPIPLPESRGGGFEERFWSVVNTPVLDSDGGIAYIIHRAEDVTEIVRLNPEDSESMGLLEKSNTQLLLGIMEHSRELKAINDRLREHEANLNTAKRLTGLGIWKLDIASAHLEWSDNVFAMYGVSPLEFGGKLETYTSLVHPDDRDDYLTKVQAYIDNPSGLFSFTHRIIRPDGKTIHVRGIGELTIADGKRVLTGVVQDMTAELEIASRLTAAANLERIAGKAARLGGWRADLLSGVITWSDETAAIHEVDENKPITLNQGINFYNSGDRERVSALFSECTESGSPFDDVFQLTTAKGRNISVRAIGMPEYGADGTIVAVHGAFQDISDLVEIRERSELLSAQLHRVLEQTSDSVIMLDRQFHITYMNPQSERLLQQPLAEAKNKPLLEVFGHAGGAFMARYEQAVATGQSAHFTDFYSPLAMWFEVDAYPVPEGVALYFRNVTVERERNEQLRLLESAVGHQNDILLITEAYPINAPEGPKIVYANNALTRITGFTQEEAVGKTPRIFQGAKTQREELERIRSALEQRQGIRTELINYTKTGDELVLEVDIIPLPNEQGEVTHFVAVERDNTERRTIEQNARINEERFHLVARATNDVIWDWDLVNDKVWWNESFENLFGYRRDQIEPGPESWSNRVHQDDREAVLASIHRVIDSSETNWQMEYRFIHAHGSAMTVIDRGFVIRDLLGKAVRMVGSMLDVTEARKLAEQLRQAQKLEAVGQLTGGVAHDFNNLLTVILGNAELLKEQLTDQQQLRMLAEITASAAERGAQLTNRLLAFARRQALEPRLLDLNRLVAGMESLLRRTLREDIELELIHAGGLWPAEVDPGQLESALLNLAINARDAMSAGGRLTIETANTMLDDSYSSEHQEVNPGQYVLLSVSDTGTGMSKDIVSRAFEPFFTTKSVGKGSGLGLSMVYGFVKQSGGHIKIYSEPGEGTTIKLYFPRATAASSEVYSATPKSAIQGGHEHILVVEDDSLVRNHVISLLSGLGYRITSASSGAEALEIVKLMPDIDLLFTDVIMPGGMNGRQLADTACSLRPQLKVLFTSGYTENAIVHHGRLDRGVQLLSKPYRRQDLAAKVRKVLEEPGAP